MKLIVAKHHFIVRKQREIFKKNMACLKFDEAFLVLDFAENYSFVNQDCTQSYCWNKTVVTIHPFVLCYLNPETK